MSSLVRVALAAVLLFVAVTARLALPGGASACSCVAPDPGAPIFTGEEEAVLIGTVGMPQPNGPYEFRVERWFKGGQAAVVQMNSERQVFPDGSTATNTCGLHFEVGDHLILAAGRIEGILTPGTCSPHAAVESAEGASMLAAAIATFGEGGLPGTTTGPDPGGGLDLAMLALGALGLVVILAIGVVAVSLLRRGQPSEPPP